MSTTPHTSPVQVRAPYAYPARVPAARAHTAFAFAGCVLGNVVLGLQMIAGDLVV